MSRKPMVQFQVHGIGTLVAHCETEMIARIFKAKMPNSKIFKHITKVDGTKEIVELI